MPNEQAQFVDLESVRVETRDGIKTVVFSVDSGEEVLFQRNKQGYVVKICPVSVETFSLNQARLKAIDLLPNQVLDRGGKYVVKKLTNRGSDKGKLTPNQNICRPSWLSNGAAMAHALASGSHEQDD
jgi:hypothetical protein